MGSCVAGLGMGKTGDFKNENESVQKSSLGLKVGFRSGVSAFGPHFAHVNGSKLHL